MIVVSFVCILSTAVSGTVKSVTSTVATTVASTTVTSVMTATMTSASSIVLTGNVPLAKLYSHFK